MYYIRITTSDPQQANIFGTALLCDTLSNHNSLCESNILSDLSLLFPSHSPQHKIFITSPNFCYWISTPITLPSCTFPRFPLSKIEASPHYSFFQLIHLKNTMLPTIKNITSLLLNSHTFGYILMVSCQINKYLVYSCCFVVLTTSVNTIVPPMFPTIKYRSLNPLEVILMIHFNSPKSNKKII